MADAAVVNKMASLSVRQPPVPIVPKKEPGVSGTKLQAKTNIYPVNVKPNHAFFKYDLRMYGVFAKGSGDGEARKEFTKQTRDDFSEQERKKACVEIYLYMCKSEPIFQRDLIYDRAAILFSSAQLPGVTEVDKTITLPANCQTIAKDAVRVEVTIKKAADTFQVTSNDLKSAVCADFKKNDKAILEVLNIGTSQAAFFSPNFVSYGNGSIYLMDPAKHGFRESDAPAIGDDKYIGIGISKGVKILQGEKNSYQACISVDVKKTAFHFDDQPLMEKLQSLFGERLASPRMMTEQLKDVTCLTTYRKGRQQAVSIAQFTSGPINQITFSQEGKTYTLPEYFKQKYGVSLKYPSTVGVVDRYSRAVFPIELLKVAPSQRVKAGQQSPTVVEKLIKESAIIPSKRFHQQEQLVKALDLSSKKQQAIGISLNDDVKPLTINARQLPAVRLVSGGNAETNGPLWRSTKLFLPVTIERWAIVCVFNPRDRFYGNPTFFNQYVNMIMQQSANMGMRMAKPVYCHTIGVNQDIDALYAKVVDEAKRENVTFLMAVCDARTKGHHQLKALERDSGIITQEIDLSKAAKTVEKNQMVTLQNVLMKTNTKLGGMSHIVKPDGGLMHAPDAMIIGLTIQQPRGISSKELLQGSTPGMPAVIGFSANNGKLANAQPNLRETAAQQYFTANYQFAHPREYGEGKSQADILKNLIVEGLKQYKANRGRIPGKVIVYRGGVSEGQLSVIASDEKRVFEDAFHTLNANYNPTLVIIAVSKEHNERFYPTVFPPAPPPGVRSNVDQNLPAGVVVDTAAVNPELNEFYLQSHKALQGTARASKYFLLHESNANLKMDAIQHMTNSLCHLHEIVNSTTAVPTPLYVADMSVKRGSEQLSFIRGDRDSYDLDAINALIRKDHVNLRFNA